MSKIDHRKIYKHLYHGSKTTPALVDVPPLNFLMADGRGKPDGQEFQDIASTLFPVAYTLKFMLRSRGGDDYHVMPMEVQWRVNRQTRQFAWTMMLMQPEFITQALVDEAVSKVAEKSSPPLLSRLRFECIAEGMCVQFLHVGPYEGMDQALEKMQAYAEQQGYFIPVRNAHDIYLNDVRKTKPENLKAIMRLAVKPRIEGVTL
jgi:hypothetical protein